MALCWHINWDFPSFRMDIPRKQGQPISSEHQHIGQHIRVWPVFWLALNVYHTGGPTDLHA
jgi:hypothetical protein